MNMKQGESQALQEFREARKEMWETKEFTIKVPILYLHGLELFFNDKDAKDAPGNKQPIAKYKEYLAEMSEEQRNKFFIRCAIRYISGLGTQQALEKQGVKLYTKEELEQLRTQPFHQSTEESAEAQIH